MIPKTASSDAFDFRPGTGFDFAYSSRDKITFAASGLETVIRIGTRGDLYTLISQTGEQETELFAGTYKQAGEHLALIRHRVFPSSHKRILSYLVMGCSVIAVAAVLCCAYVTARNSAHPSDQNSVASQQVSPEDMQALRDYLMSTQTGGGKLPARDSVPGTSPAGGAPVTDGANMLGVPSYQPKLYEEGEASPETVAPSVPTSVPAPVATPNAPAVSAPEPVKQPVAKIEPLTSPAQAAAEVSALKDKVSQSLKGSNLSKAQAEKALNEISMLTPHQLSEASLDSLPPEVRQMVLDQMQSDTSETSDTEPKDNVQEGIPTKLIMLPQQVIDGYRGHDGIASLPENSSWQARGNPAVQIPLPGGGDINSVEDLKAFGVQP